MRGAKAVLVLTVTVGILAAALPAVGAVTHYRVTFTGADLLNNQFVDGDDGTTAADNDLYDGARVLMWEGNSAVYEARTFIDQEREAFDSQWEFLADEDYTYNDFNLWGLDATAAHWGEDYKVLEWLGGTGPDGWFFSIDDFGIDDFGYPYWWTEKADEGLLLSASSNSSNDLEALVFTVDFLVDANDAWWDEDTKGKGSKPAPKSFENGFVMWFGGYVNKSDDWWGHMYDGNMLQTATVVTPEPASVAIWSLIALAFVAFGRFRRPRRSA